MLKGDSPGRDKLTIELMTKLTRIKQSYRRRRTFSVVNGIRFLPTYSQSEGLREFSLRGMLDRETRLVLFLDLSSRVRSLSGSPVYRVKLNKSVESSLGMLNEKRRLLLREKMREG